MQIAIIGTGNVGGALAKGLSRKHQVVFGVRNPDSFKGKDLADALSIPAMTIADAVKASEVIILSATVDSIFSICEQLGDLQDKVVIDAMNSVFKKPEGYNNTFEVLLARTNGQHLAKCFNTTGFENMENPVYHGEGIDMFMCGDSEKAKTVCTLLSKDIGFAACYDFGGNDKVNLIEQFAMAWINLAILQKQGRDIAFKVIHR